MIYDTHSLLKDMQAEVSSLVADVVSVRESDIHALSLQPDNNRWSVQQILEHLNAYNRYYLPAVAQQLPAARKVQGSIPFKPGWLGDYFTRSMYSQVKTTGKVVNRMSAMKGYTPPAALDTTTVLNEFIAGEQELTGILLQMANIDMSSCKIPVTLSRFIRINIGDAMRFLVAHQVRHHQQIKNTLSEVGFSA